MNRFLRRQTAIMLAAMIFGSQVAAQDDPNALMNDAISLYTSAIASRGEERYQLFQEVDGILSRIKTEFPDSAPASLMEMGIPLGPIDQKALDAELAASEPKLADRLSGELAEQWRVLRKRSPDVAATVENTLKKVSGSAVDEAKEELYVKATYYVMASFYYVTDSAFHDFFDPTEAGLLYQAFVTEGGLERLEDIGRSTINDIALGVALDFGSSTIAEFAVENGPEMEESTKTLVRAAIKSTITEVLLAVQASKDPTKIPGLGIKRVSEIIEIIVLTRGLAAHVDKALIETAMRMQTMAQMTAAYREQEGVQNIITSTRKNLASEIEEAVGKDDAEAVANSMLLGWAALTAEFEGDTVQAERLHGLLLSRGNIDNMPTIWNAPDLLTYLANGFTDSPKRAVEIMIGVTELSKYSKAPEPMAAITTPSTAPELAETQIAPDGFLGPEVGTQLDSAYIERAKERFTSTGSESLSLIGTFQSAEQISNAQVSENGFPFCARYDDRVPLRIEPDRIIYYESSCRFPSLLQPGQTEYTGSVTCSGEGETWDESLSLRLSGDELRREARGYSEILNRCDDDTETAASSENDDWGPEIVSKEALALGFLPCGDRTDIRACLAEKGVNERAIEFSMRADPDRQGLVFASRFVEIGDVDLAETQFIGNTVYYSPLLLNGEVGIHEINFTRDLRGYFRDSASQSMLNRYPRASSFSAMQVSAHRVLEDGTQRFVLIEQITDGCRVCEVLGSAVTFIEIWPNTGSQVVRRPVGMLLNDWPDDEQMSAAILASRPQALQVRLNSLGYDAGSMDGVLGAKSRLALTTFQAEHCLSPTGRLDAATLDTLISADGFNAPCARGKLETNTELTIAEQVLSCDAAEEAGFPQSLFSLISSAGIEGRVLYGRTVSGSNWNLRLWAPGNAFGGATFTNSEGETSEGFWRPTPSGMCQSYNDRSSWVCHSLHVCEGENSRFAMRNANNDLTSVITLEAIAGENSTRGREADGECDRNATCFFDRAVALAQSTGDAELLASTQISIASEMLKIGDASRIAEARAAAEAYFSDTSEPDFRIVVDLGALIAADGDQAGSLRLARQYGAHQVDNAISQISGKLHWFFDQYEQSLLFAQHINSAVYRDGVFKREALRLSQEGDLSNARSFIARMSRPSSRASVLAQLSQESFRQSDAVSGRALLDEAIAQDSQVVRGGSEDKDIARALVLSGNTTEAMRWLNRSEGNWVRYTTGHTAAGLAEVGETEMAMDLARRLTIFREYGSKVALDEIFASFQKSGQYSEFENFASTLPDDGEDVALSLLANAYAEAGSFPEAVALVAKLSSPHEQYWGNVAIARSYARSGNVAAATEMIASAATAEDRAGMLFEIGGQLLESSSSLTTDDLAPNASGAVNLERGIPGKYESPWEYMEWVQVASRRSLDEARDVSGQFTSEFPKTQIFKASNGWYAVVVDYIDDHFDNEKRLAGLIDSGQVPRDAILTTGSTFIERFSAEANTPLPPPEFVYATVVRDTRIGGETQADGSRYEGLEVTRAGTEVAVSGRYNNDCNLSRQGLAIVPCSDLTGIGGLPDAASIDSATDQRKETSAATDAGPDNEIPVSVDPTMVDSFVGQIENEIEALRNVSSPADVFQTLAKLAEVFHELSEAGKVIGAGLTDEVITQAFTVQKWTGVLGPETVGQIRGQALGETGRQLASGASKYKLQAGVTVLSMVGVWVADAFLEYKGEAWLRSLDQGFVSEELLVALSYQAVDGIATFGGAAVLGANPATAIIYTASRVAEVWVEHHRLMGEYDELLAYAISSGKLRLIRLQTIPTFTYDDFVQDVIGKDGNSGIESGARAMMEETGIPGEFTRETGRKLHVIHRLQVIRAAQIEGRDTAEAMAHVQETIADFDEQPATFWQRYAQTVWPPARQQIYALFARDVAMQFGIVSENNPAAEDSLVAKRSNLEDLKRKPVRNFKFYGVGDGFSQIPSLMWKRGVSAGELHVLYQLDASENPTIESLTPADSPFRAVNLLTRETAQQLLLAAVTGGQFVKYPQPLRFQIAELNLTSFKEYLAAIIRTDSSKITNADLSFLENFDEGRSTSRPDTTRVLQWSILRELGAPSAHLRVTGHADYSFYKRTHRDKLLSVLLDSVESKNNNENNMLIYSTLSVGEVEGIFQKENTAEVQFNLINLMRPGTEMLVSKAQESGLTTGAFVHVIRNGERDTRFLKNISPEWIWTAYFRKYDDGWRLWSIK